MAALLTGWQAPAEILNSLWLTAILCPVAGLIAAVFLKPTAARAARIADLQLELHQQLGTAEELLSRKVGGSLVSMQLASAASVAEGLAIARAFPLFPRREVVVAALLALLTAGVFGLASAGIVLPNPLATMRLPSLAQRAEAKPDQKLFGNRQQANPTQPQSPALDSFRQTMDQIQKQSLLGRLPGNAASAMLAQAGAELNRVAAESQAQQQALDALSSQLRNTAAGKDAGESLRQGDAQQAAQQIQQLGQQSDQLSDAAKQELADALNRAAQNSQGSPDLANAEKNAARQLQDGEYSDVTQSMDQLAQSVQDAANQTVSQSELAQSWQQLQQLSQKLGQGNPANSQNQPPVAQASPATGERTGDGQQNAGAQGSAAPSVAQQGAGQSSNQPGGGSTPGNQRGGPPLGAQNPRLGPDGQPLDVQSSLSGQFSDQQTNSPQPPSVTRQGTGNAMSSGGDGTNGPTSVPAENVIVPGERRPTVRDYFSKGSGNQ